MSGTVLGYVGSPQCNDNNVMEDEVHEMSEATEPGRQINVGNLARVEHDEAETIMLQAKVAKVDCTAVPDTGASHSVIDATFVEKAGLSGQVMEAPVPLQLNIAGNTQVTLTKAIAAPIQIGNMRSHIVMYVMPSLLQNVDLIIGMNWMRPHNTIIDTASSMITVEVNNKQYKLYGEKSGTIGLASLRKCLSEQKYISAKQAALALKKGCTGHLLMVQSVAKIDTSGQEELTKIATEHGETFDTRLKDLMKGVLDVFSPLSTLPQNKALYPVCPTKPDAPTPSSKPYRLSPLEEKEVETQLADLLAKGFIEPSCSPYGAPVLFVQKKDGSLRMCIDYRALNKHTIRDHFPIPRIDTLLDNIGRNRIFTTLDLQSGYHQMLLHESDVPKTAFVTHRGQYQFKVLCFGLTNAPSAFQRLMNSIFRDLIDARIVQIYLDDILVMSKNPEEHLTHLAMVFERLQKAQLRVKMSKCEWAKTEVKFLGHIIGHGKVRPDPAKIDVIRNWPIPRSLKALQGFLGLVNFFRVHVDHLSCVAAPLLNMTSDHVASAYNWQHWKPSDVQVFEATKQALADAVELYIPDLSKPFTVHSDASDVGCGATLLQDDNPVAFFSHKYTGAESRYPVHDREALALYLALKQWRCYLENSDNTVCLTDHKPLVHLLEQSSLNRRQSRWLEFMSRFPLCIKYIPGKQNVVADALSRFSGVALAALAVMTRRMKASGGEACEQVDVASSSKQQATKVQSVVDDNKGKRKPKKDKIPDQVGIALYEDILRGYNEDPLYSNSEFTNGMKKDEKGIWRLDGKIVVPNDPMLRTRVIKTHHDAVYAGHRGVRKTLELIERLFWWPAIKHDVETHVKTCSLCQQMKSSSLKKAGLLQPLQIPPGPWQSVSMDLITGLPQCEGYDSILVFVDRFTKYVLCVPTTQALDAKGFAKLFIDHVVAFNGMPDEVVSDRGPQFTSLFWKEVCETLGVKRSLSSAYHPESDGQTERMNRILEDVLRHYVSPQHKDWVHYVRLAQFAINNSWHEATTFTPFYLNHGRHPKLPGLESLELEKDAGVGTYQSQGVMTAKKVKWAIHRAKQCLWAAQDRMRTYANQRRRDVTYKEGDMVMLSTANLRTQGSSRKLMPKYVGPFEVREMVGKAAVRLHLSAGYERLHNVFHVSLVKPYKSRPGEPAAQVEPLPWLVDEQGEPQYEVEAILEHQCVSVENRKRKRTGDHIRQKRISAYFVKWKGYDETSWVTNTPENMSGCKELVEAYRRSKNLVEPEYEYEQWLR